MSAASDLRRHLANRASTDWQTRFWRVILLSLITFGIYGAYVLYRLLDRRQQHFERMFHLRAALIDVLEVQAGKPDEDDPRRASLAQGVSELRAMHEEATARDRAGDRTPVLWLVLCLATGVAVYYVYWFLNHDFHDHALSEERFFARAGELLGDAGLIEDGVNTGGAVPARSFLKYFLLSIVTLGLFAFYWYFTIITDPNRHFAAHARWEALLEDELVHTL